MRASPEHIKNMKRSRTMARINYVELPVSDTGAAKAFYEAAFGWSLAEFGPTYAATTTGDVDLGLQGDTAEATAAPLPVIAVEGLDAWPAKVEAAGGRIVRAIFAFPGGRRFHFVDPSGNELAVVEGD
jgi:predicted enzyme related to lactoylglutathione lyase